MRPSKEPLLTSQIDGIPVRRGKVRDMYELGERLLMVSTDRISAFDFVLPAGIPDKGRVLTQLSAFWFRALDHPHHLISTSLDEVPLPPGTDREALEGRSMVVRKTNVVPIECVVRGYLAGSGWKEYRQSGTVCGLRLPPALKESSPLPEPIFTPATKAESGHDENISLEQMTAIVGQDLAETLQAKSLDIYRRGAEMAQAKGIVIADTKFEWGWDGDRLLLIDEVFTPDSSRFWPADAVEPGSSPPSFDKQFVRDWLTHTGWDKDSAPPEPPAEVVQQTRARYIEAYERLTGSRFAWA